MPTIPENGFQFNGRKGLEGRINLDTVYGRTTAHDPAEDAGFIKIFQESFSDLHQELVTARQKYVEYLFEEKSAKIQTAKDEYIKELDALSLQYNIDFSDLKSLDPAAGDQVDNIITGLSNQRLNRWDSWGVEKKISSIAEAQSNLQALADWKKVSVDPLPVDSVEHAYYLEELLNKNYDEIDESSKKYGISNMILPNSLPWNLFSEKFTVDFLDENKIKSIQARFTGALNDYTSKFDIELRHMYDVYQGDVPGASERFAEVLKKNWEAKERELSYSGDEKISNDLSVSRPTLDAVIQDELVYKQLFLEALQKTMNKEGLKGDVKTVFAGQDNGQFGSQSVLCLQDWESYLKGRQLNTIGPQESTTKYKFEFAFINKEVPVSPLEHAQTDGVSGVELTPVTQPIFKMDSNAFDALKKHGITHEELRSYAVNFMQMGGMAEHDYVHRIILPVAQLSTITFRDGLGEIMPDLQYETPESSLELEDHALAIHAKVCQQLYEDRPNRKDVLLGWAGKTYSELGDIQSKAFANCKTDEERAEVTEAITYFSEIYAHRLFRVISPEDAELQKEVQVKTQTGQNSMSVAQALEKVRLVTPAEVTQTYTSSHGNPPSNNLETMIAHMEYKLGDTYSRIHKMESVKMMDFGDLTPSDIAQKIANATQEHIRQSGGNAKDGQSSEISSEAAEKISRDIFLTIDKKQVDVSLAGVVASFRDAAVRTDPSGAFEEVEAERIAKTREASKFREVGNNLEAWKLEVELRQQNIVTTLKNLKVSKEAAEHLPAKTCLEPSKCKEL